MGLRTRRAARASLLTHADDADVPPAGDAVGAAGPDGRVGRVTVVAQGAAPAIETAPEVIEIRPPSPGQLRKRDQEVETLWRQQYARLAGWCAMVTGNKDEGRDIADEAFTRLLARWFTVRDPKGFVYVTATNLMRDHWRSTQRDRGTIARLRPFTQSQVEPADPTVRDLVERLPERLRAPLLLFWWADLPVKDIAAWLGIPEGTVKRQLKEGRAALRLAFEVPE